MLVLEDAQHLQRLMYGPIAASREICFVWFYVAYAIHYLSRAYGQHVLSHLRPSAGLC